MRARVKDVRERVPPFVEEGVLMGVTFAAADVSLGLIGHGGAMTTLEAAHFGVLAGLVWGGFERRSEQ